MYLIKTVHDTTNINILRIRT